MSFTTYTGSTNKIASLGTTPEERGLTTEQFKAKFDEFAAEFVAWFNTTHVVEGNAHLAETATMHGAVATATADKLALRDSKGQVVGFVPGARVCHNAAQSIANASYVTLAFNTERFDTDTIHDTVTNNERLTCKTAGKYLIVVNVLFDANVTGTRELILILNGATNIGRQTAPASATQQTGVTVATVYDLAVNDYVTVMVYQSSGGALNILAIDSYSPEFMMVKVG